MSTRGRVSRQIAVMTGIIANTVNLIVRRIPPIPPKEARKRLREPTFQKLSLIKIQYHKKTTRTALKLEYKLLGQLLHFLSMASSRCSHAAFMVRALMRPTG